MHPATFNAFQDELIKISVSQNWVAKKVLSGGSKTSPERVEKFGKRMLELKAKGWKSGRRVTIENASAAKKAADKFPMAKTSHYQDSYGEPGRPAPSTGKKVLKGALLGAGVVGGGLAAKHYGGKALKKGIDIAKGHLSEAVEEGIKRGTKGALWNALKRK